MACLQHGTSFQALAAPWIASPRPLSVPPPVPQAYFNGHDHNLQHLHKRTVGYHQICSGAGSRVGPEFRGHKHSPFQYGGNGESQASSAGVAAAVCLLCWAHSHQQINAVPLQPPRARLRAL